MDSTQKEVGSSSEGSTEAGNKRCCSDCKTTKTPLWRSGPSGPKSLCNACGIKQRKRRPKNIDLKKGKIGKSRKGLRCRNPLKINLMIPLEKEVPVKKKQSRPRQWGEVERAALLLMALSCGAVFA